MLDLITFYQSFKVTYRKGITTPFKGKGRKGSTFAGGVPLPLPVALTLDLSSAGLMVSLFLTTLHTGQCLAHRRGLETLPAPDTWNFNSS